MQLLKHRLCLEQHRCPQGRFSASAEICRTPAAAVCLDQDIVNCYLPACNTELELQVNSYF